MDHQSQSYKKCSHPIHFQIHKCHPSNLHSSYPSFAFADHKFRYSHRHSIQSITSMNQEIVDSNEESHITNDQYLKQVKMLQIYYGYRNRDSENTPILPKLSKNSNEKSYIEQGIFEDRFENDILSDRFDACQTVISRAKQNDQMFLTLWEFSSMNSRAKTFKMDDSLGFEERNSDLTYGAIEDLLRLEHVDLKSIQMIVQSQGLIKEHRAYVWQLLLNYLDPLYWNRSNQLERNRRHYYNLLDDRMHISMSKKEFKNMSIIMLDSPRTRSFGFQNIYQLDSIRKSLERILYIWSSVYINIGYFQGLNEIASILYTVFLESALSGLDDVDDSLNHENSVSDSKLKEEIESAILLIEPDVYYCLEKVMLRITEVYPTHEGGLFTEKMSDEVERIIKSENSELWEHLKIQDLTFYQFTFRWLLCLFIREFTTKNAVCIWDAYISEGEGFAKMHVYTTAAFILTQSKVLFSTKNSEKLMGLLMGMPTMSFSNKDIQKMIKVAKSLKSNYVL